MCDIFTLQYCMYMCHMCVVLQFKHTCEEIASMQHSIFTKSADLCYQTEQETSAIGGVSRKVSTLFPTGAMPHVKITWPKYG